LHKARQGQCKPNTENLFYVEAQPVLAFAFLRGKGTAFFPNTQTFPQLFCTISPFQALTVEH